MENILKQIQGRPNSADCLSSLSQNDNSMLGADCTDGTSKDQEWADQAKGRWWHKGEIICYYCGERSCEDEDGKCCAVRRQEVLRINDSGRSRKGAHTRKKNQKH